ncbi:MAG TPA: hypothetical protein VHO47_05800 [Candidatus Babeliales bacterium]|nr:hypothetical protein [Candidatus Babeliales bacterium]
MNNLLKFIAILFSTMSIAALGAMGTSKTKTSGYYEDIPQLLNKTPVENDNKEAACSFYQVIPELEANQPEGRTAFLDLANNLILEARNTKILKEAYTKYEGAIAYLKNVEQVQKNVLLLLSVYNEFLSKLATNKPNNIILNNPTVNITIEDAREYLASLKNTIKNDKKLTELRRSILNNIALIKVQQLLFADQKEVSTPALMQAVQILSFLKSDTTDQQKFINNLRALSLAFILENEISSAGTSFNDYLSNAKEALEKMDDMIDKKGLGYQRLIKALDRVKSK